MVSGTISAAKLEEQECLRRFLERDPAYRGEFLVGVLTTGIYCLPGCRARMPKVENVRFFADESGARAAGLRPCKRCRPDDFYRRFDPDLERAKTLASAVREDPARFADTAAMARHAGLGPTKLNALFRRCYHHTPGGFLVRARVRRAQERLFARGMSVLAAGEESGFESASAFHENFRTFTGLTPAAYRELGRVPSFQVHLPQSFDPAEIVDFFGRDPNGCTERVNGTHLTKALLLEGVPARIELDFGAELLEVAVESERALPRSAWRAAHQRVVRWLGLDSDPAEFERRAKGSSDIARLVRGRTGLRLPRSTDLFEGLVWVVVGAQVNIAFASTCRAALIELAGTGVSDMRAHPTPTQVARLDYADLVRRQFSRRKAEYLIDAARAIEAGELDLEGGRDQPVPAVVERLSAVRGLGPWSVQYLCMRSYGFEDCAPIGDVALAEALKRFYSLAERPESHEATRLMEPFAPHRSLATRHLWRSLSS